MTTPEPQRAKVAFSAGAFVERMYAIDIGEGRYVLDNSPFHVYGISCGDVFSAVFRDGDLVFASVIARGGHSTYRVRLPEGKDHCHFLAYWDELQRLGCTFEGSGLGEKRLYALDIPPSVDVAKVYRYLEEMENEGVWQFEEAHYFDPGDDDISRN